MSENKLSLFELTKNLADVLAELESQGVSVDHLVQAAHESIANAHADKVTNYVDLLSKLDSDKDLLKKKVEHYKNQIEKLDSLKEKLHDGVIRACDVLFTKQLKGTDGHYLRVTIKDKINVEDPKLIPPEFISVITKVREADVKKALQSGQVIPGAKLDTSITVQKK